MEREKSQKISNEERVANYLIERFGVESMEELKKQLDMISEESKTVFMSRWGLDGSGYCSNYAQLGKKLNRNSPERLYRIAEQELFRVVTFVDSEEIPEDLAKKLTELVFYIFDERKIGESAKRINAKELVWTIMTKLSLEERIFLFNRFGIFSQKSASLKEIEEKLNLSGHKIWQIQHVLLQKLRDNADDFVMKI